VDPRQVKAKAKRSESHHVSETRRETPDPTASLQSALGNRALTTMLQRETTERGSLGVLQREPATKPSKLAASGPSRIRSAQKSFHGLMKRSNAILSGTRDHLDYVNGIYAENVGIYQVVMGQASAAAKRNEEIQDGLIGGVQLLAQLAPGGPAVTGLLKLWQFAEKVEEFTDVAGKMVAVSRIPVPAGVKDDATGGVKTPDSQRVASLEMLLKYMADLAKFRDHGDSILDTAVDAAIQMFTDEKPDKKGVDALASACERLVAETQTMVDEITRLETRRAVKIPSWQEVEQDIWLIQLSRSDPHSSVIDNHCVDIGLWGPFGKPGGRLGIADEEGSVMIYEGTKTIPGHEDEEQQQSLGAQSVSRSELIRAEAAKLPQKWAKILLSAD
jgi:hypothetical protein